MIGKRISHFEVLATLGEGGMGVVYRARDLQLDREVALKVLPPRSVQDESYLERFRLEARSAATLNHPHICTIYEYDEIDGRPFIAMELVRGQDLAHRVSEGAIKSKEALRIAAEVASGLALAHDRGIVHRDIKPANILLDESGAAKITDFGLARLLGGAHLTQTGMSMGTMTYMSPEQVRGTDVGPPSDVWSLGCIVYEMLLGAPPFHHDYAAATLYAIANESVDGIEEIEHRVGSDIAELVKACLEKDPAERPTASRLTTFGETGRDQVPAGDTGRRPEHRAAAAQISVKRVAAGIVGLLLAVVGLISWFSTSGAENVDLSDASLAFLPAVSEDSLLKTTLDGMIGTLSKSISDVSGSGTAVRTVHPFDEVISQGVISSQDARGKLGADFVIQTKLTGSEPIPVVSFHLMRAGREEPFRSVTLPLLLDNLNQSYTLSVRRVGSLLNLRDSILVERTSIESATSKEAFQLYTRATGLLQQQRSAGSLRAADTQLRQALEIDPDFAAGYAALGRTQLLLFEMTKDPTLLDEAERLCDRAIRLDSDLIDAYVTLGSVHRYTGRMGQAQGALETALEEEPFNTQALLALADVFFQVGDLSTAEATYERAVQSSPRYWSAYNRFGKFYSDTDRYDEAAEHFQKVVDLAPTNPVGYRNLGTMMYLLERTEQAEANWKISLEIEPFYSTYFNLGVLNFYEQDYAEAARAYEKALELNDQDHRVWGALGSTYYFMDAPRNQYTRARSRAAELAEAWLDVNPTDRDVQAELAGYYGELGNEAAARTLLERLGPEPTDDFSGSLSFQIGAAWEQISERERALAWIEHAVENDYPVSEITSYPGLEELRSDSGFVRIMDRQ